MIVKRYFSSMIYESTQNLIYLYVINFGLNPWLNPKNKKRYNNKVAIVSRICTVCMYICTQNMYIYTYMWWIHIQFMHKGSVKMIRNMEENPFCVQPFFDHTNTTHVHAIICNTLGILFCVKILLFSEHWRWLLRAQCEPFTTCIIVAFTKRKCEYNWFNKCMSWSVYTTKNL